MAVYRSKNLEIHTVDHCNLDCVGCSHESPLMARRIEDPDRLGAALTVLWRNYETPLVKLLGGEPLLHPALGDVIHAVRATTGARIRAITNGTLLSRRFKHLQGVDEVHISQYPGSDLPSDEELQVMAAELRAPITVQGFNAFRWHRVRQAHNPEQTARVFKTCQMYHSWECHTLRDGRFYPCPPAGTWGTGDDGVDLLAPGEQVPDALARLLGRDEPLETCATCLGSAGQLFQHRQGWRSSPAPPAGMRIDGVFLGELEQNPTAWNNCYEYHRTIQPSGQIERHRGV